MDPSEIERLASRPKESLTDLYASITALKSNGAGILDCIIYVKKNQDCSLEHAGEIVINSSAWESQKEAFLQEQSEYFEEFLADNIDKIEAIHLTFTPGGTKTVVQMKQSRE